MSEWKIQCGRFNHDRLKNQFLQAVMRLIRVLEGRVIDEEYVEEFVGWLPSAWSELDAEARQLLANAASEIGPSAWFRAYPLNRVGDADRAWMTELMSNALQLTMDICGSVKDIEDALDEVGSQCQNLVLAFHNLPHNDYHTLETTARTQHDDGNTETLKCAVQLYQSSHRLSQAFRKLTKSDAIRVIAGCSNERFI